jgi:hypothetical protein
MCRKGIIALHSVWVDIVVTENVVGISETDARGESCQELSVLE